MRTHCMIVAMGMCMSSIAGADVLHVPGTYFNIQAACFDAVDGDIIEVAADYDASTDSMGVGMAVPNLTIRGVTDSGGGLLTNLAGLSFNAAPGCEPLFEHLFFSGGPVHGGTIWSGLGSPDFSECTFDLATGVVSGAYTGNVTGCTFMDSSGTYGYVRVFLLSNTTSADTASFTDCTFDNLDFPILTESSAAGTVIVDNCVITECRGGVIIQGGTAQISDTTFRECFGTPLYSDGGTIQAEGCDFIENAANEASAVELRGTAGGSFSGCNFTDNTSNVRGAIHIETSEDVIVSHCTVSGNAMLQPQWGTDAGGISTQGTISLTLSDTTLCDNSVDNIAAAVHIAGTVVDMEICPVACEADVNSDDVVDVLDLLIVINMWGACP